METKTCVKNFPESSKRSFVARGKCFTVFFFIKTNKKSFFFWLFNVIPCLHLRINPKIGFKALTKDFSACPIASRIKSFQKNRETNLYKALLIGSSDYNPIVELIVSGDTTCGAI